MHILRNSIWVSVASLAMAKPCNVLNEATLPVAVRVENNFDYRVSAFSGFPLEIEGKNYIVPSLASMADLLRFRVEKVQLPVSPSLISLRNLLSKSFATLFEVLPAQQKPMVAEKISSEIRIFINQHTQLISYPRTPMMVNLPDGSNMETLSRLEGIHQDVLTAYLDVVSRLPWR